MKEFLKRMAAKLGCDRDNEAKVTECEQPNLAAPVTEGQPCTAASGDTEKRSEATDTEERVKGMYQICPLSSYNGGRCLFALWYFGTLHCFYGGDTVVEKRAPGGIVVEQPNVMCPKKAIWADSKRRKIERMKYGAAMRELAEMERAERGLPKEGKPANGESSVTR